MQRAQVPSRAQGTIEYLVVLAIVVVVGLVVVGLSSSIVGGPAQQLGQATTAFGSISNPIRIVDAVTDPDGNTLLTLQNNSGNSLTVTKIALSANGAVTDDQNYNNQLIYSNQIFHLTGTQLACPCLATDTKKTCTFIIYTTNQNNLPATYSLTVTTSCVTHATTPTPPVEPIDNISPAVYLLSPADNNITSSSQIRFDYNVTDNKTVSRCTLKSNGTDVNTKNNPSTIDSFIQDFSARPAGIYNWSVACTDGVNTTTPSTRQLTLTDSIPPVVYLLSPVDQNINQTQQLEFDYNATDNKTISNCTLKLNGTDVNTKTNPSTTDSFIQNFSTTHDGIYNWTIACTDGTNTTTPAARQLNLDLNDYELTYCAELEDINYQNVDMSGYFKLMNDVNCYADTHQGGAFYHNGAGFTPIGASGSPQFAGTFDGNGHKIFGVYIYRPTSYVPMDYSPAFFGQTSGAKITKLGLVDINVTGPGWSGPSPAGMIGSAAGPSTIENSFVTGSVYSQGAVGGMIGAGSSTSAYIINSYADVNLYGSGYWSGELCPGGCIIINSYATGNGLVPGSILGGLVGNQPAYYGYGIQPSITNSFSTGSLVSDYNGGIVSQDNNNPITNSYWSNSAPNCVYSGTPVGMTCTKVGNKTAFYNIAHNVYTLNAPLWTFGANGTDKNWSNICNGVGYPPLMWEGITNTANCRK